MEKELCQEVMTLDVESFSEYYLQDFPELTGHIYVFCDRKEGHKKAFHRDPDTGLEWTHHGPPKKINV